MKLAILVNTDRHKAHVLGIVNAAVEKGHEVVIFSMDDGTRLLEDAEFTALSGVKGVSMSFCDHSTGLLGVKKDGIPEAIVKGSQFNNAMMNSEADRVIVL